MALTVVGRSIQKFSVNCNGFNWDGPDRKARKFDKTVYLEIIYGCHGNKMNREYQE